MAAVPSSIWSRDLSTNEASSGSIVGGGEAAIGADRRRALIVGARREDSEPFGEQALGRTEQVPAPLHHRPQRPMARQARPVAAGEQTEAIRQPGGDLGHGQHPSRAAASSMASGSPSSRRTISTTGPRVAASRTKSGRAAVARSSHSRTAG